MEIDSKPIRKKIIALIIVVLIVILGVCFLGYYFYQVHWPANDFLLEKEFKIEKGQGVNEISKNLKQAGLIQSSLVFETYLWLHKKEGDLQAGNYVLRTNMSVKELASHLNVGLVDNEREIVIIEGWKNVDIANYLDDQGVADRDDFLARTKNRGDLQEKYSFLKNTITLEGFLFPDTYRIFRDAEIDVIIEKMLANFDDKLADILRQDIAEQGKSIYEIITMASIIEKEVHQEGDRRLVADIFYKRLKIDMPLQSDATVNYVTGKKTTRPSYDDTRTDSLYNTYKYKGLPPGPICNPGLDAIMAAIYPQENDYWFFLTTKEGTVIYGKDAEEHSENRAKYLD